jgi:hypothetical protein
MGSTESTVASALDVGDDVWSDSVCAPQPAIATSARNAASALDVGLCFTCYCARLSSVWSVWSVAGTCSGSVVVSITAQQNRLPSQPSPTPAGISVLVPTLGLEQHSADAFAEVGER